MEAKGARLVFLGPCDFCSLCQYFFALVQFNILPKTNKITKVTKFLLFTITLLSPLKSICRRNQPSSIKMQTLDYFRQLTCACLLFNEPCARDFFFFFLTFQNHCLSYGVDYPKQLIFQFLAFRGFHAFVKNKS